MNQKPAQHIYLAIMWDFPLHRGMVSMSTMWNVLFTVKSREARRWPEWTDWWASAAWDAQLAATRVEEGKMNFPLCLRHPHVPASIKLFIPVAGPGVMLLHDGPAGRKLHRRKQKQRRSLSSLTCGWTAVKSISLSLHSSIFVFLRSLMFPLHQLAPVFAASLNNTAWKNGGIICLYNI